MKYHINPKNEVDLCSAQVKCRFGGRTGKENHFATKAEAVAEAERRNGVSRDPFAKMTKANTAAVLKKLSEGGFEVKRIRSVAGHDFSEGSIDESSVDVLEGTLPVSVARKIAKGETVSFI